MIAGCRRVLEDSAEAEDVAQEAFVAAYRALASYRGDGPLGAWVTRIALRLALRRVRQRARMVVPNVLEPAWAGPSAPERLDPARLVLDAERARDLRAAVAALPDHYREVVSLRFFGELSLQEIAAMTGRPLGTVKTHLRRGLARLREQVGADA